MKTSWDMHYHKYKWQEYDFKQIWFSECDQFQDSECDWIMIALCSDLDLKASFSWVSKGLSCFVLENALGQRYSESSVIWRKRSQVSFSRQICPEQSPKLLHSSGCSEVRITFTGRVTVWFQRKQNEREACSLAVLWCGFFGFNFSYHSINFSRQSNQSYIDYPDNQN